MSIQSYVPRFSSIFAAAQKTGDPFKAAYILYLHFNYV